MIRNNQQLKSAYDAIHRFESFERSMAEANDPRQLSSRNAIKGEIDALLSQIEEYNRLRDGHSESITIDSIYDIPEALIKARIARGWSQADLAKRLGVKPQQIQRWEADDYESINSCRLFEIADVLGLADRVSLRPSASVKGSLAGNEVTVGNIQPTFHFYGQREMYGTLTITSSLKGELLTTKSSTTTATVYSTQTGSYMIVNSDDHSKEGLYRKVSSLTGRAANFNFDETSFGSTLRVGGLNA